VLVARGWAEELGEGRAWSVGTELLQMGGMRAIMLLHSRLTILCICQNSYKRGFCMLSAQMIDV
jgi:hypothetical protein